jgi:uncharacterized protein
MHAPTIAAPPPTAQPTAARSTGRSPLPLLLPRMNGVFGRRDWVANGVLFAVYHLHVPWVIPQAFVDICVPWASKRYQSALVGIAVHSVQSVFFAVLVLALVLK